jgi:hypothetical protein
MDENCKEEISVVAMIILSVLPPSVYTSTPDNLPPWVETCSGFEQQTPFYKRICCVDCIFFVIES